VRPWESPACRHGFEVRKSAPGWSSPLRCRFSGFTALLRPKFNHILRALCGHNTLMTQFVLRKGAVLPRHSHPHEQTGYLVRGRIRLSVGADEYEAEPGDSWSIPGGVEHGATALEDSVTIEVFAPVRQDYLPGPDLR
jgi:unsaturated pyranuronate lyase